VEEEEYLGFTPGVQCVGLPFRIRLQRGMKISQCVSRLNMCCLQDFGWNTGKYLSLSGA